MAKGIPVTKEEFDKAKLLLDSGVPKKMIAELLTRDQDTIKMMGRSDTYEDYIGARAAINARKRMREAEQAEREKQEESQDRVTEHLAIMTGYLRECARMLNELVTALK